MNTHLFSKPRWSPWVVGELLGMLSILTFVAMHSVLGVSTTPVRAVGALEATVAAEHVQSNAYFAKYLDGKPAIDWQFALVLALPLGAWLAARTAVSRPAPESVPALWSARFGPSKALRYGVAFVSGMVLIVGARIAGGCTSGHGISGGLQLAVGSYMFLAAMFLGGVITAFALYGPFGKKVCHVE